MYKDVCGGVVALLLFGSAFWWLPEVSELVGLKSIGMSKDWQGAAELSIFAGAMLAILIVLNKWQTGRWT